tara:strand:+ start:1048 stop:1197 length:150 start_codon:yes stop_codon:yes gene_type:complete
VDFKHPNLRSLNQAYIVAKYVKREKLVGTHASIKVIPALSLKAAHVMVN